MLNCIVWDTSTNEGVIALGQIDPDHGKTKIIKEMSLALHSSHSEGLLWGLHEILKSENLDIHQIDLFVVGVGPGSFTGLRIGLTTARTFAHSLKIPLIGVSSLSAWSQSLAKKLEKNEPESLIVCCQNAFGGEVYAFMGTPSQVRLSANQKAWSGAIESSFEPEQFIQKLKELNQKTIAFGDAFERYPQIKAALLEMNATFLDSTEHIQGQSLIELGLIAYQKKAFGNPLELTPQYLRGSSAEEKMKKGLLEPSPTKSPL